MADLSDPDLGAAYYRSSDPVKNLKIRVKLSRISSSNIVPHSNLEQDGSNLEMQKVQESLQDIEERVFDWQQKEFSKHEVDLYQNIANCTTQLEKDYNAKVTEILNKGPQNNRLFTYVDHDKFSQQDEAVFFMTNSPKETPTILADKMAHLRRRKIGGGKKPRDRGSAFVPKFNIVEEVPSEELRNKNHIMAAPAQVMYIMADLGPKDRPFEEGDEVVLCSLQLDANGVLCIRPDFNRGRKPYVAETASLGREVFEYTIEHDSKVMSRQEQDKEIKMYREVYGRHKDFLSACVGHEFELPPPEVLRLLVCGEIEKAKNFEYDDLYIHFFVDIPKNWKVDRHQQLSWVTQTCATKVEGRDNVAHFSFPFEFDMFYKDESYSDENKDPFPHFPFILMEVLSLDSWNRFRTEGYTYVAIPPRPGVYKETVHCWRPLGTSFVSEMRRFFIGGTPELEDSTYTAIPSTFDGPYLSKYGFRTETTGSVDIKFNVIMQSRSFLEKKASKKSLGSLLDTLGINTVQQNIQSVLDAFKKARHRMVIARENATRELLKDSKHKDDLFSRTNR
ncbi:tectonic-like complex member MKS1 [Ostrea edulis]|uniref:tectonic-like complex member MKS1 n=1 Tax=Ostrea edulis TaxID=37623 RepID=UPI0024AF1C64|nr:tectonic-like complex member MKS1 [Ostrea edulis]